MPDTRHAATVILSIGADDASVLITLECDVCGRSSLSCAPSHLRMLARLLTAAAERAEGVTGLELHEREDA